MSYLFSRHLDIFLSFNYGDNDSNDDLYKYSYVSLTGGIIVYF